MTVYSRTKSSDGPGGLYCPDCNAKVVKQRDKEKCPGCGKKLNWDCEE